MQKKIFLSSVFFVLGFATVFSILGVLLQTALLSASQNIQIWLARIGGVFIMFFGVYLMGILRIPLMEKEYVMKIEKRFSSNLTSFLFGAAFAAGWTPCIGAVLGGVLTLALTQPSLSFILLFAYSIGLGIPFLIVGAFTEKSQYWIKKFNPWFRYIRVIFGAVLIGLGILVFKNSLGIIGNFTQIPEWFFSLDASLSASITIPIAFLAGLVSFLSPCVLPLIPAYLTYLASVVVNERKEKLM